MSYRRMKTIDSNPQIFLMEIKAPAASHKAEAGQFIILRTDKFGELVPFTIADYDREKETVTIIIQAVGKTTKGLDTNARGYIIADKSGSTSKPFVHAGSDTVTGAAIVIFAMGAEKTAVKAIHEKLSKEDK